MKLKISLYAVTLIVIYYVVGYIVIFQAYRGLIRFEQLQIIAENRSATQFFSFPKAEWVKMKINSREFGFGGKLFDIVEVKVEEDFVRVEAIGDEKELTLLNEFSDCEENSEDDSLPLTILTFHANDFFPGSIFQASIYESNRGILNAFFHLPSSQFSRSGIFVPPDFLKG